MQEFDQHFNNAITLEEVSPPFGLGAERVQEAHRKFKHSESKKGYYLREWLKSRLRAVTSYSLDRQPKMSDSTY